MNGASGLDAHEWRRLCTSHKGSPRVSYMQVMLFVYPPIAVTPLLACRLIALNKNPGARPIGIGDTAFCIIAKAVLFIAAPECCLQLFGSQMAGIEAAVHASMYRQVALQNICCYHRYNSHRLIHIQHRPIHGWGSHSITGRDNSR